MTVEREHTERLSIALEAKDDKLQRLINDFESQLHLAHAQYEKSLASARARAQEARSQGSTANTALNVAMNDRSRLMELERELEQGRATVHEHALALTSLDAERTSLSSQLHTAQQTMEELRALIRSQTRLFASTKHEAESEKKRGTQLQSLLQASHA